jgi:hypothetical protein
MAVDEGRRGDDPPRPAGSTPPTGPWPAPGTPSTSGGSDPHAGGSWTPPDAGQRSGAGDPPPGPVRVEAEPDGPPTPPPVRARRRRWAIAGIVAGVLLVVGVPVGLAVAGWLFFVDDATTAQAPEADGDGEVAPGTPEDAPDDPGSPDGGPDADPDGDPDADPDGDPDGGDAQGGVPPPESLDPPDLDGLEGLDAVYGQLLVDIDASEEVMMAFQSEVGETFASAGTSPDELVATLRGIAADRRDDLLEVRDRLEDPLDDGGAESVRESYVVHLDSWADYMAAVEDDPQALAGEGSDAGYTVAINATADAFSRSLEQELPDDVDDEVERYADGILDRGFRGSADAQV